MNRPTLVLYHAQCADGFGAAFAAWCSLGDGTPQNPVSYIPVQYDEPFPVIPDGARVFIVDFSYPTSLDAAHELAALAARCALVVIDHHKTAGAALQGQPWAVFDLEKSGAVLTWEFFQGQRPAEDAVGLHGPPPDLLLYIQDRDLWKFELPNTREFSAGLSLVPKEFNRWLALIGPESPRRRELIREGAAVLKRDESLVLAICRNAYPSPMGIEGRVVDAVLVNTPVLQSDACHALLKAHPEVSVAAAFYVRSDGTKVWSLRSRPGVDCSWIARAHGGGGHPQACGFTTLH